jgi:hypothetical protein
MSIRVLNPTVGEGEGGLKHPPRVADLNGKVLGVLHNGRQGNLVLLDEIVRVLESKYSFKEVVRLTKPRAFNIAPEEVYAALVPRCDAVITGVGD